MKNYQIDSTSFSVKTIDYPGSWFMPIFVLFCFLHCHHAPTDINNDTPSDTLVKKRIVCFGTSLTYGFRTSCYALGNCDKSSYPSHLSTKLCAEIFTEGFPGAYAMDGIPHIPEVMAHSPDIVLLEFGGNEFLTGRDLSLFHFEMDTIITTLINHDITVILLLFGDSAMAVNAPENHPFYKSRNIASAIDSIYGILASEYNLSLVSGFMRDVYNDGTLMTSDNMHPNREGYRIMAETIYHDLESFFRENGMICE